MSDKEIKDLLNTIEYNIPIEEYKSEGTSDGLCHYELDEESWQYKTLKYVQEIQQENQQLKEQLKYKQELIEEIKRNVNNNAFEVYTKEYGNIEVVEANVILETKIRRNK